MAANQPNASRAKRGKQVLTEREVLQAWQEKKSSILVPAKMLITPAARDAAKVRKIELRREGEAGKANSTNAPPLAPPVPPASGIVAIGADHGGYALKEQIKIHLRELGYRFQDFGTFSEAPVDYPDVAEAVATEVANSKAWCGIVIDGAGIGSAIAANKIPGVRAANCHDLYTARNSREHNNANVLTLGSRNLGIDIVKEVVQVWLATGFGGGRHLRRVEKIGALEKKFLAAK
ncbi:MAG: ribose 5-phosphate isomerase B [bacterium]